MIDAPRWIVKFGFRLAIGDNAQSVPSKTNVVWLAAIWRDWNFGFDYFASLPAPLATVVLAEPAQMIPSMAALPPN
jgi:hypothetical protein